jgi:hypothetical protein
MRWIIGYLQAEGVPVEFAQATIAKASELPCCLVVPRRRALFYDHRRALSIGRVMLIYTGWFGGPSSSD